jgi:2-dehydropantoate 2-reductase
MKICFFGVGGVGGYMGTLIAKRFQNVHDIYFVARGNHKEAINRNGLTLKIAGKETIIVTPLLCTDKPADLPICDIIFLTVKGYDLQNAAKEISKLSTENTIILPLLNGVDIYERIRENLPDAIVLPACVYIGTHIESPGIISQNGGSSKISLGKDPMHPEFYPESLLTILKDTGIDFEWKDNVKIAIWSKFMFIAAFGLVTATFDKTLGELMEDRKLSRMTKSIMSEICEIAKKLDIPLNPDLIESSFIKAKLFPYEAKTSLQRDVESKGKINEGDLFGGTLIRFGRELKISVPYTEKVYNRFLEKLK